MHNHVSQVSFALEDSYQVYCIWSLIPRSKNSAWHMAATQYICTQSHGIMQYMILCAWLLPLSMFSWFLHVIEDVNISLITAQYSIVYHIFFIHSSVGNLGCFYSLLLWIMLLWAFDTSFYMDICFHFSLIYV